MLRKRIQLGLIHVAVAMTLVPINSTLNRVMIKELAISATLVAIMASLPYLISPVQVAIGSYSDRHPLFGLRRTPYILAGLILCVIGVSVSPYAAFMMGDNFLAGLGLGILAFGAWGIGYNLSAVAYLSLASELSGEEGRGRTIAVMWFMMIVGIILTSITLSRLVDPYTPEALIRAFLLIGGAALLLGIIGLLRLEPRHDKKTTPAEARHSWKEMILAVWDNQQARLFFIYLVILLAALLGQDILLEPFGGEAFDMPVNETTRITSIWGVFVLLAITITGALERKISKRTLAVWGGWGAFAGFMLIAFGGLLHSNQVFYLGVVFLGLGTGVSTVSNLSLMLDMTVEQNVGLFIGAWGVANAISRLLGSILGGAGRDMIARLSGNVITGYVIVFFLMAGLMLTSIILLRQIDVQQFRKRLDATPIIERAAMAGDM